MNVILLIVLGIIIWFFIDRNKMHNEIQSQGGMKRKYAELLTYLLHEPEARITKETNDSIQVEYKTNLSYVNYYLFHNFDKIRLSSTLRTPVHGEISKSWEFPLNTNQSLIFKKISQEMIQFANEKANWDTDEAQNILNDVTMDNNDMNLESILAKHILWLSSKGKEGERADLTHANIPNLHFPAWDIKEANLTGATFEMANLKDANLMAFDLSYTTFTGADLTGANFHLSNLSGANLSHANLSGADLSGTNLTGANFFGTNLSGANLSGAEYNDGDLFGAQGLPK